MLYFPECLWSIMDSIFLILIILYYGFDLGHTIFSLGIFEATSLGRSRRGPLESQDASEEAFQNQLQMSSLPSWCRYFYLLYMINVNPQSIYQFIYLRHDVTSKSILLIRKWSSFDIPKIVTWNINFIVVWKSCWRKSKEKFALENMYANPPSYSL